MPRRLKCKRIHRGLCDLGEQGFDHLRAVEIG
jgi:hypothetical protein